MKEGKRKVNLFSNDCRNLIKGQITLLFDANVWILKNQFAGGGKEI